MKLSTAAAATALAATAASALTINTPASLVQCQPVAITFGDGTPPYYVSIIPRGDTSAVPLVQFPEAQSGPITWTVNVTGGTNIGFQVVDSTGAPAYSTPIDVQNSGNTACLNASGGGASGSASASAGASASGAASSGAASGAASSGASATSSAAGAASSAAQPSGGAGLTKSDGGVAAVFGLVAAALGLVL